MTLTRGAPAFPIIIIALVPFRLLVMKRWWPREALRFVDAWACREGTPEDDEDALAKRNEVWGDTVPSTPSPASSSGVRAVPRAGEPLPAGSERSLRSSGGSGRFGGLSQGSGQEWVELDFRTQTDEELGRAMDDQ